MQLTHKIKLLKTPSFQLLVITHSPYDTYHGEPWADVDSVITNANDLKQQSSQSYQNGITGC